MWANNDALVDVLKGLASAPFIMFCIVLIITMIIIASRSN